MRIKDSLGAGENAGNQRRYKPEVLRRVSVIKAAQKVGVSLEEIKQALATLPNSRTPTTKDWETLATRWRDALSQRIAYMEKLRDYMSGCIGCGCLSMKACPMYNPEDKLGRQG